MTVYAAGRAASAGQSTTSANNLLGKDEFLKLLITELRYQDATDPMKDREFIAQMAQFSTLEQMQNLNKTFMESFQALTYQLYANGMNEALNLLGKEVIYLNKDGEAISGTVEALKQENGIYKAVVNGADVDLGDITLINK